MTDAELHFILDAVEEIVHNVQAWGSDYSYNSHNNEYAHRAANGKEMEAVTRWFDLPAPDEKAQSLS
jgi:hypothetical protein